jgi:hypothetical protein
MSKQNQQAVENIATGAADQHAPQAESFNKSAKGYGQEHGQEMKTGHNNPDQGLGSTQGLGKQGDKREDHPVSQMMDPKPCDQKEHSVKPLHVEKTD